MAMFANERVERLLRDDGDALSRGDRRRGAVAVVDRTNRGVVVWTAARRPRITTGMESVLGYEEIPNDSGISKDKILKLWKYIWASLILVQSKQFPWGAFFLRAVKVFSFFLLFLPLRVAGMSHPAVASIVLQEIIENVYIRAILIVS